MMDSKHIKARFSPFKYMAYDKELAPYVGNAVTWTRVREDLNRHGQWIMWPEADQREELLVSTAHLVQVNTAETGHKLFEPVLVEGQEDSPPPKTTLKTAEAELEKLTELMTQYALLRDRIKAQLERVSKRL